MDLNSTIQSCSKGLFIGAQEFGNRQGKRCRSIVFMILPLIAWMPSVSQAEANDRNISAPSPQQVVARTMQGLQAALSLARGNPGDDPSAILMAIDRVISNNVAIPRVTRMTLGRHWVDTSDAQKKQLLTLLHRFALKLVMLIDARPSSLNSGIAFLAGRSDDNVGSHSIVRTMVGDNMRVNYHLCTEQGAWKIYDVTVDGISFMKPVQASMASVVHQHGVDELITRLEARVGVQMMANNAEKNYAAK
jgi:phospholipid transport system substrate-binding protein